MFEYFKRVVERSTDVNELIEVLVFHSDGCSYEQKCEIIHLAQAKLKTLTIF